MPRVERGFRGLRYPPTSSRTKASNRVASTFFDGIGKVFCSGAVSAAAGSDAYNVSREKASLTRHEGSPKGTRARNSTVKPKRAAIPGTLIIHCRLTESISSDCSQLFFFRMNCSVILFVY